MDMAVKVIDQGQYYVTHTFTKQGKSHGSEPRGPRILLKLTSGSIIYTTTCIPSVDTADLKWPIDFITATTSSSERLLS